MSNAPLTPRQPAPQRECQDFRKYKYAMTLHVLRAYGTLVATRRAQARREDAAARRTSRKG